MAKYGPKQQVRFQHRTIWGGNPPAAWTDDKPTNYHDYEVVEASDYQLYVWRQGPVYTPKPGLYTGAWLFDALIEWQSYVRDDDDPTDLNVYIEVTVKPIHHHVWASCDDPAGGFCDIGAIYVNDISQGISGSSMRIPVMNGDNSKRRSSRSWTKSDAQGVDFCMESMDHSRRQLESCILSRYQEWTTSYSSIGNAEWLVGCILENRARIAWCLLPNGGYSQTTASGDVEGSKVGNDYWMITKTFAFPPEAFDADGGFKPEWAQLPMYTASRSVHWPDHSDPSSEYVQLTLQALFNFDLDDPHSLFNYIPWAVLKDDDWTTCNRPSRNDSVYEGSPYNDGLQARKGSRWENHYIWNNSMNPSPSGDSDGFRVQSNSWVTSPRTP